MKLENIGSKIISIGTTVVMPGDKIDIAKDQAELPSIKALAAHGFVKVVNEFDWQDTADSEQAPENVPDAGAEEESQKQPRKRGMNKITKE